MPSMARIVCGKMTLRRSFVATLVVMVLALAQLGCSEPQTVDANGMNSDGEYSVELSFEAEGLDRNGSRVLLSVDSGESHPPEEYVGVGELLWLRPGEYQIKPKVSPIASDGRIYRVGYQSTEGHHQTTVTVGEDGTIETSGAIAFESIRACDATKEELAEAIECVRDDPERSQEADRLEAAAKAWREEGIAARKKWARDFDFDSLAQAYEQFLQAAGDVEFGVDDPTDYLGSLSLRYSLADLSGDDIPELLLCKERSTIVADYETETFAHTRVVYYDEKEKVAKLVGPRSKEGVPDDQWASYVIETGTAIPVGKPENEKTMDLNLSIGASGHCLLRTAFILTTDKYTLVEGELVRENMDSIINYYQEDFYELDDLKPLEKVARGKWLPRVAT